jgi:hypothetical protein
MRRRYGRQTAPGAGSEAGKAGETGENINAQERQDVEVYLGGQDGRSMKFRIGVATLIQVVVTVITLGGASVILRADVDRLSTEQAKAMLATDKILTEVTELKTTVNYLRDEVRYYRERIDKLQERTSVGTMGTRREQQ